VGSAGARLLCLGARLLQWSWDARGYGRGADVSGKKWGEFKRRLEQTRETLLKCAEKSPDDPTPWSYLIMVATWSSDEDAVKQTYFDNAIKRDPENWSAHMHLITALYEKWGGSLNGCLNLQSRRLQTRLTEVTLLPFW
jgi:hypothetical protein